MENPNIAVVGAGIIGLSTAFVIKRDHPNYIVSVITDKFSPHVTSDGAPGYLFPGYQLNEDHPEFKWCAATQKWLIEMIQQPDSFKHGVSRCSGYLLADHEIEILPDCKRMFPDLRTLTAKEMEMFPPYVKSGYFVTKHVCESSKYLPFLLKKFSEMGGLVYKRKVKSFEELSDYDVVVNCTGMGAVALCSDKEMFPIRGQIIRVKAPWIRHFYRLTLKAAKNVVNIYPNNDFTVLGGTSQVNDNKDVNMTDKEMILRETAALVPTLKGAEEICDWVGLRPGRSKVRIEEEVRLLSNKRNLMIVHNYGHGRKGITLHYGCALEASEMVHGCVQNLRQITRDRHAAANTEITKIKEVVQSKQGRDRQLSKL